MISYATCSWGCNHQEKGPAPLTGSSRPEATQRRELVFYSSFLMPLKITRVLSGLGSGSSPLAKKLDQESLHV